MKKMSIVVGILLTLAFPSKEVLAQNNALGDLIKGLGEKSDSGANINASDILDLFGNKKKKQDPKQDEEQRLFEEAQRKNTIKDYDAYLTRYPQGKYVTQANTRKEQLLYDQARNTNTVESYNAYLRDYPNGRYAKQVEERRSSLWGQRIRELDTIIANARNEKEDLLFSQAQRSNTLNDYDQFINEYPNSPLVPQAVTAIFNIFRERNDLLAFEDFLQNHPKYEQYLSNADRDRIVLRRVGPEGYRVRDLIQLKKNGIADALLVARLNNTLGNYKDFSIEEIKSLQDMGLPNTIISAMILNAAFLKDKEDGYSDFSEESIKALQNLGVSEMIISAMIVNTKVHNTLYPKK